MKAKCRACGKLISINILKCPNCGVSFTNETFRCPICRAYISSNVEKCGNCGAEFQSDDQEIAVEKEC